MLSKADGVLISLKVELTHFLNIRVIRLLGSESENTTPSNSPPFLYKSLRQYYSCLLTTNINRGELRGTENMKSKINVIVLYIGSCHLWQTKA